MHPGIRTVLERGVTPLVVLIGLTANVLAANPGEVSPEHLEGARKVSAEEVFSLYEKTPNLVIVDSRLASGPSSGRANGYIEGSVSLPDTETSCASLAKVIPGKTTPSLFYCNGPKCGRSAKAIKVARQCGYGNIYWFRGGFEEWLKKGYPFVKP
ncbi:MAG: rhodanese-like domain-containing protein [Thiobacillaceae bacterium]|jgi:rhodanese-related sulfurtransferase|nr:rhodanese-like domain-containing protein [Thiobacillaceae bacterium]